MESLYHQQYSTRLLSFLSFFLSSPALMFCRDSSAFYMCASIRDILLLCQFTKGPSGLCNMLSEICSTLIVRHCCRPTALGASATDTFSRSSAINAVRYASVRILFCKLCCTHFVYLPEIRNTDNSRASRNKTICTLILIRI
jgi:hypothetical protein